MRIAVILILIGTYVVNGFVTSGGAYGRLVSICGAETRRTFHLESSASDEIDPYGDFLDLNAVVDDSPLKNALVSEWSIAVNEDDKGELSVKSKLEKPKKQWEHWDDFMQEQFGDMDRELAEDETWMYAIRDAVEMKRGMAIWSKRSDKEINAEKAKSVAKQRLKIPVNFANIITRVFLEKTASMKEMRSENELHVIEFRKWMIEQRKKFKQDPLPIVKVEVSRNWLAVHPYVGLKARGVYSKPVEVVMDELRHPLADVQFEIKKSVSGKTPSSMSGASRSRFGAPSDSSSTSTISSSGSLNKSSTNKVTTASMINWEMSASELPEQMTSSPTFDNLQSKEKDLFKIDEVDILVATEGDYYVVM